MIREIKKIYNIELVKFNGINEKEIVQFTNPSNYYWIDNKFFLVGVKGNHHIMNIPVNSYIVKEEELDDIYIASNIREIVERHHKGEISIEDENLMKEFIDSYREQ